MGVLFLVLGQLFISQWERPFTLWAGIGFFLAAFFTFSRVHSFAESADEGEERLPWAWEFIGFTLVLAVALFLRTYEIHEFPGGVGQDRAASAWGSLRILFENWRPGLLETYSAQISDLPIYYFLALWFKLFGASPEAFAYFDVFISLAAFPFLYWAFRQLSGPRTALAALGFLAIMRWHFHLGRGVNTHIEEILFWMSVVLALWLYALRKGRNWAFVLCAGLLGVGLYGYSALKGFLPAAALFVAYEAWADSGRLKRNSTSLWMALLVFTLAVSPLLHFAVQNQSLGRRESKVSVWRFIQHEKSLAPLGRNLAQAALMFNREGDASTQFNFGRHPMLDNVTGPLFVLGAVLALRRLRRRDSFYALVGLGCMTLPAVLSVSGFHAGRAFGAAPFAAYLAALGLGFLCRLWGRSFLPRRLLPWAVGILFLLAGIFNFTTYFLHQAKDPYCLNDFCPVEMAVGRKIQECGKNDDCLVSPWIAGRYTVRYLSYFERQNVRVLQWPLDLGPQGTAPGRGRLFILPDHETGHLDLLKRLYPGGQSGCFENKWDQTRDYWYRIPRDIVDQARGLREWPASGKGMRALGGSFFADASGLYRFQWRDPGIRLFLDRRMVSAGDPMRLAKGFHSLRLEGVPRRRVGTLPLEVLKPDGRLEPLGLSNLASFDLPRGMLGRYFLTPEAGGEPFLEQRDPIIDFHSLDSPAGSLAARVKWVGEFQASRRGRYDWSVMNYPKEKARIRIDGEDLTPLTESPKGSRILAPGTHRLELEYQHEPGLFSAMILFWKKPGDSGYGIVPNEAFGNIPESIPSP